VGYSRSKMSDEEFRDLISENLTCRVTSGEDCGREMEEYLARCTYVAVRGPAPCSVSTLGIAVKPPQATA
jgi:glucose-6-phosphate 1-dehydrogenase